MEASGSGGTTASSAGENGESAGALAGAGVPRRLDGSDEVIQGPPAISCPADLLHRLLVGPLQGPSRAAPPHATCQLYGGKVGGDWARGELGRLHKARRQRALSCCNRLLRDRPSGTWQEAQATLIGEQICLARQHTQRNVRLALDMMLKPHCLNRWQN